MSSARSSSGASRCEDRVVGVLASLAIATALVAAALAAYMLFEILRSDGVPGCGWAWGCREVLGSRWSHWAGVPVVGLAVGAYGTMAVGGWWLIRRGWAGGAAGVEDGLAALAWMVGGAVGWFVALQAFVVHRWCGYCMADHALGLLAAGCTLGWLRLRAGRLPLGRRWRVTLAAAAGLAVLIGGQLLASG